MNSKFDFLDHLRPFKIYLKHPQTTFIQRPFLMKVRFLSKVILNFTFTLHIQKCYYESNMFRGKKFDISAFGNWNFLYERISLKCFLVSFYFLLTYVQFTIYIDYFSKKNLKKFEWRSVIVKKNFFIHNFKEMFFAHDLRVSV